MDFEKIMQYSVSEDGSCFFEYSMYEDEYGKPVKRTPQTNPYSYDGHVIKRVHENDHRNATVYSDRLLQWDHDKYKSLWKHHCGDSNWKGVSSKQLNNFLRAYNDDNSIEVTFVMEYCNMSNGCPLWRVDYFSQKIEDQRKELG